MLMISGVQWETHGEGCRAVGKSPRFAARLHLEAVIRRATLAGGPSTLSLAHKLGRPGLWSTMARFVATESGTIAHPGDPGRSNLHGVVEHVLPQAVHSYTARAFAAGPRRVGRAVAFEMDETVGKLSEG